MELYTEERLERASRRSRAILLGGGGLSDVFRYLQTEVARQNAAFFSVMVLRRISKMSLLDAKSSTVWIGFGEKVGMSDEELDARYLDTLKSALIEPGQE